MRSDFGQIVRRGDLAREEVVAQMERELATRQ